MTKRLICIGYGYTAQALARLLPGDWDLVATTRDGDKARALCQDGITTRVWPGDDLRADLDAASHVLCSVAPNRDGDPFLAEYGSVLAQMGHFSWVGYLSTTGVYGDHGGAWVDEDTPLTPGTRRGVQRVAAEQDWQALGLALHIFRLAGIYGPGRGPFSKVQAGTARQIIKPGQVFSRVHVDDIAGALWASMQRPRPGIYNICDDEPAPPQDVLAYAAQLLGLPAPETVAFEEAELSPLGRSFYAESKRVSNARMKQVLGVRLQYPDYRAGLQALLAEAQGKP